MPFLQLFESEPLPVTTDSRNVPAGSIFFALRGDNFDGNQYALGALEKGAAWAVIDNPVYNTDPRCILVEDGLAALQEAARHYRRRFSIPIIAITGSNGKTTTKELTRDVLAAAYKTHATVGNLNNHIGVPLTLLRMPLDTEMAVIEMGANHQGEIAALCAIAEPTHGLVTNMGKAHLEGFGGEEGVRKGKSEMYLHLAKTGGMAFVNRDQPHLLAKAEERGLSHVLLYGEAGGSEERRVKSEEWGGGSEERRVRSEELGGGSWVKLLGTEPFLEVEWAGEAGPVRAMTQLHGGYNLGNIATAIAVGQYFGVPSARIKGALENYAPENNRSQLMRRGAATIIMDAYNANPTSMGHALEALAGLSVPHKGVVLGEMLELGDSTAQEHQWLADKVAGMSLMFKAFIGKAFSSVILPEGALHFGSALEAREWFQALDLGDAHVLVKGSRGNKLEVVISC